MQDGFFDFKVVRRRFKRPFLTGNGPVDAVDRILLRTQSQRGTAYGEIAPWPGFPTESFSEALEVLRSAQGNLSHLTHAVAATAGLPCLQAALSSCRHWEGIRQLPVTLPCAGLCDASTLNLNAKIDAGYSTLKLKIRPTTSVDEVTAVLKIFSGQLRLDANGSLDLATARIWTEFVRQQPSIDFLEQPLPIGHAGYASLGRNKIALDESFLTPGGTTWEGPIVVKPMLVGDWDEFLKWKQHHAASLIYSSAFETAIGRQGALWLASHNSQNIPVGFDTLDLFENDARERHLAGPVVSNLINFDWEKFWLELT
jgi:O-succinylbenzoate synthase